MEKCPVSNLIKKSGICQISVKFNTTFDYVIKSINKITGKKQSIDDVFSAYGDFLIKLFENENFNKVLIDLITKQNSNMDILGGIIYLFKEKIEIPKDLESIKKYNENSRVMIKNNGYEDYIGNLLGIAILDIFCISIISIYLGYSQNKTLGIILANMHNGSANINKIISFLTERALNNNISPGEDYLKERIFSEAKSLVGKEARCPFYNYEKKNQVLIKILEIFKERIIPELTIYNGDINNIFIKFIVDNKLKINE